MSKIGASANQYTVRPDWLATCNEPSLDPDLPILDAHHHLYDRPGLRYLLDDYLSDLSSGHNIFASVFIQARSMLRQDGPEELKPVGEVEFANGVAAASASGIYGPARVCAGIVGAADLCRGDAVRPVLERLIEAGGGTSNSGGRFRGIRHTLVWDDDTDLLNQAYPTSPDLTRSINFREGFAHLAPLGLSFEAWAFFPQLQIVAELARAFPQTQIVLNHMGGIVRIHRYNEDPTVFDIWRRGIAELARCPNVSVKLSGLGMRISAFGFETAAKAPSSEQLAQAWAPWVMHCIESFGPSRCMWGSNFPVDKGSYSLNVGLNAFKRILAPLTPTEQGQVFAQTAAQFYQI